MNPYIGDRQLDPDEEPEQQEEEDKDVGEPNDYPED